MPEDTLKWRLARHVADHFDPGGISSGIKCNAAAFVAIEYRTEREISQKRLSTAGVHVPHGRANLRVRIGRDVFHQEVNKATVSLKNGEHLGRRGFALHIGGLCLARVRRWLRRLGERGRNIAGNLAARHDREEGSERKLQTREKADHVSHSGPAAVRVRSSSPETS